MAKFTGMTYTQIIEMALLLARQNSFPLEFPEVESVIDQYLMETAKDVLEKNLIHSQTWPTNSPPSVSIETGGYMFVEEVFGDATPLHYIDYAGYRELFLGSDTAKPENDVKIYYTILGNTLYLEPDVTGFTNLVVQYAPLITKYADRASVTNIPELPKEYRILVPYYICKELCPAKLRVLFEELYNKQRRRARSWQASKLTDGGAEFWDPFAGSESYRQSGWPGKLTSE